MVCDAVYARRQVRILYCTCIDRTKVQDKTVFYLTIRQHTFDDEDWRPPRAVAMLDEPVDNISSIWLRANSLATVGKGLVHGSPLGFYALQGLSDQLNLPSIEKRLSISKPV